MKCLESPIDQENVEGYRQLKDTRGYPFWIATSDNFVVVKGLRLLRFRRGGSRIMQCANIISAANKPFWMQVGFTGISAVFMVHLAAAVPNASRDHVSLFKLLEHSLLTDPLQIAEGMAGAPEKPGFGVEIDMDTIDKYLLA